GSILRYRHLGYALALVWAAGLALGVLHPWGVLLLAAGCAVHVAFLAGLGVWLSLVNRTSLWANMCMAMVVLLFVTRAVSGLTEGTSLSGVSDSGWWTNLFEVGLNPPRTWWFAAFSWEEVVAAVVPGDKLFLDGLTATLTGLAVFGVAAYLLWWLSLRRF